MSRHIPEHIVNSWSQAERDAYNAIAARDAVREAGKTTALVAKMTPDEYRAFMHLPAGAFIPRIHWQHIKGLTDDDKSPHNRRP